jgi:hypothetical protein
MSLELIEQANLLIQKTMNSSYRDNLKELRKLLNEDSIFSFHLFKNTVNIAYSQNLITKSSRDRLLRLNEQRYK